MKECSIRLNSIFNMIKTCFSIIFPLITFPYISRVLLIDNVGKVNFGAAYVSYFSLIASLGITTYAIRECAAVKKNKIKLSNVVSQIYSINIITTIVSYVLLFTSLILFRNLDNYRLLIIIQSTVILFTTLGADWLNSAMEDFLYITIRTITFQFISLALMFAFVHNPDDYIKYAAITVVSSSGASIANVWYRQKYCKVRFTTEIEWKRHIKPIVLLFVMILAQTIFSNVGITMLGFMKDDSEVGIYSAANKMLNIISQLIASLLFVIMPKMSSYFAEGDYKKINVMLRKVLGFNILLGFPCVFGVICSAKDIILLIAGESFIEAVPVLRILMICLFFSLFGGNFLGNAILLPSKGEQYYMAVCCITAVVNIITNYYFIPLFGASGAASSTALSGLLILVLLLLRLDKKIQISNLSKLFIAPTIGCILIALTCYIFSSIANLYIRILARVIAGCIVYVVTLLLLKNEIAFEVYKTIKNKLHNK